MIPVAEPLLGQEELNNVTQAIKSGWISSKGKFIPEFEEKFAAYCGTKYGVATSNGTTALHLALAALGMGRGDRVIVPTLTFIATANAVRYTGAIPVFVDSTTDYWGIDPERIEAAITRATKAIIPVHLYGHPCDMDRILDIARRHNLYVVEDAAEAHGAEYKGHKVGSLGDVGCFSFFGNKIITTGEGGMCLTNRQDLAERMRILRDHGMSPTRSYWHDTIGFNYRMTNMQAAVGVAQLEKLDGFIEKKRLIARWYQAALQGLVGKKVVKPHPEMPWAKCVFTWYSILVEVKRPEDRDEVIKQLRERGIETRPLFYPVNIMPPYKNNRRFPMAISLSRRGISLPSSVKLTKADIDWIAVKLKETVESIKR